MSITVILTILSKWCQHLKDHLLLLMFHLLPEEPDQLLGNICRGELLLTGLCVRIGQKRCVNFIQYVL